MRIWLVEDPNGTESKGLETALKQWTDLPCEGHVLVAVRPIGPCFAGELRSHQVDAVVIPDAAWPDGSVLPELLDTGITILAATTADRCERYQALAQLHPIWFIPTQPTPETLRLALKGLAACSRRQNHWKTQLTGLQQRLNDRVVIERAKGILVQRLGIAEEEAYQRLRLSSRRQRRQIRDIAQSLLDTQSLLLPELNGIARSTSHKESEISESSS